MAIVLLTGDEVLSSELSASFLRGGGVDDAETAGLFPPARPANEPAGLREITDLTADDDESLRFTDGDRIE